MDASALLESYLAGLAALTRAEAVTLFVPSPRASGRPPVLLHHGAGKAVPELSSLAEARTFARSVLSPNFEPEPLPSRDPSACLVPLPLQPSHHLDSSNGGPGGRNKRRHTDRPSGSSRAWLAFRFTEPLGAPDEFLAALPAAEQSWPWLLDMGTAVAAHATQFAFVLEDPLTGLVNRVGFQALLAEELERAKEDAIPLALLLINPDDFEMVNERFSRRQGDRTIRELGQVLQGGVRRTDLVARYGGAIFAIILVGADPGAAGAVAAKLTRAVERASFLGGALDLGVRIGGIVQPPPVGTPPRPLELVRRADHALNAAKRGAGAPVIWEAESAPPVGEGLDRLSGIFTGDLGRDYRNMSLLRDIVEIVAGGTEFEAVAEEIVDRLSSAFRARRVALFAHTDGTLSLIHGRSAPPEDAGTPFELTGPERAVVQQAVADRRPHETALPSPGGDHSGALAYAIPLVEQEQSLGALFMAGPVESLDIEPADLIFAKMLASQLAAVMEKAQRTAESERQRHREQTRIKTELTRLRQAVQSAKLVYQSPQIEELLGSARALAATDAAVLVSGEAGSGKKLLARTLHGLSSRRERGLAVVDLSTIPDTLIEAELFGPEPDTYTGALPRRPGRLLEAEGGTLLLEEVAELPRSAQARLLRFLQEQEIDVAGEDAPVRVDVRLLATTRRNLHQEAEAGRFHRGLLQRLEVAHLEMPPLRQRPEDILHLARHFLETFAVQHQREPLRLAEDAEAALTAYEWPGNVRELQNRILQAVMLAEADELDATALGLSAPAGEPAAPRPETAADSLTAAEALETLGRLLAEAVAAHTGDSGLPPMPLGRWLAEDLLLEADRVADGVARRGARSVGLPETTYRRRLAKARRAVAAGLSPRTGNWQQVRRVLATLFRAPDRRSEALLARLERLLLQEIVARCPEDQSKGASLLGVTLPTYRRRLCDLSASSPIAG